MEHCRRDPDIFVCSSWLASLLLFPQLCELAPWRPSVPVPIHRRPLSAPVDPLLEAGFALERLLEPTPTAGFKHQDPKD